MHNIIELVEQEILDQKRYLFDCIYLGRDETPVLFTSISIFVDIMERFIRECLLNDFINKKVWLANLYYQLEDNEFDHLHDARMEARSYMIILLKDTEFDYENLA